MEREKREGEKEGEKGGRKDEGTKRRRLKTGRYKRNYIQRDNVRLSLKVGSVPRLRTGV